MALSSKLKNILARPQQRLAMRLCTANFKRVQKAKDSCSTVPPWPPVICQATVRGSSQHGGYMTPSMLQGTTVYVPRALLAQPPLLMGTHGSQHLHHTDSPTGQAGRSGLCPTAAFFWPSWVFKAA